MHWSRGMQEGEQDKYKKEVFIFKLNLNEFNEVEL